LHSSLGIVKLVVVLEVEVDVLDVELVDVEEVDVLVVEVVVPTTSSPLHNTWTGILCLPGACGISPETFASVTACTLAGRPFTSMSRITSRPWMEAPTVE